MTVQADLPGYRRLNGFVWPESDPRDMPKLWEQIGNIDTATDLCQQRRVVVQAGGHCGVWPKALSERFETVYTFEPDRTNFTALVVNTADCTNIIAMNAALGLDRRPMGMANDEPENCAAGYIHGEGSIPVLRLDDFGLPVCDLLYLDVEGYELQALHGARRTIQRCRPVIGLENKRLGRRYGEGFQQAARWLTLNMGYRVAEKVHKDVILVPETV